MTHIMISRRADNQSKIDERIKSIELNKLKMNELRNIIQQYGITETQERKVRKADLINGIISYERTFMKGKQTSISMIIDKRLKEYFVETVNNLLCVSKVDKEEYITQNLHEERYFINNRFFSQIITLNHKTFYEAKINGKRIIGKIDEEEELYKDELFLLNDIKICRKVIFYIESLHFYLKVKYLLRVFDNNNDIIRNICLVYFERTLCNVSDLRCKIV